VSLGDILSNVPPRAVDAVFTLVRAIVAIVQAGDDAAKHEEALMTAAEDLKALRDRAKFGAG
jgi:hypothetical protein